MTGDPSHLRLFLRGFGRVLEGVGVVAVVVGVYLGRVLLPSEPDWTGLAVALAGAALFAAGRHLHALALRRLRPEHDD